MKLIWYVISALECVLVCVLVHFCANQRPAKEINSFYRFKFSFKLEMNCGLLCL